MSFIINNQTAVLNSLVYLVDNDRRVVTTLSTELSASGYQVQSFSTLLDFIDAMTQKIPAVIIVDGAFISSKIFGELAGQAHAPLIICVSESNHFEVRLSAVRNGAKRFFTKPLNINDFNQALNGLTGLVETAPYRVLCIDDEEISLRCNQSILEKVGMTVEILSKPLSTLEVLSDFKPDVIVLDVYMPECSGIELAQIIRQDKRWAMVPIVFLSGESNLDKQLETLNLGGDDFLVKPIKAEHFAAAITARAKRARMVKRLNQEIKHLSIEQEFQLLTMDQHNIVSITDTDGKITHVNQLFCEISGYSEAELIGQNHRLLNSGFHPRSFYSQMWSKISHGDIWHGILCNRKKNGEEFWLASTIVPYLDDNGTPYKYVSIRTDISAFKHSQERLQRSQTFANIGTWDWNIKTGELYWSERVAPLFGYDTEISKTTYRKFLSSVHPDDKKSVTKAMRKCINSESDYESEHRIIWPDGSIHWMLANGNVVRNKTGTPVHMLGVIKCIDKRKHDEFMLAEHDRLLLEAQSLAHIGNWQMDLDGDKLTWSDELYRILGFAPNEINPSSEAFKKSVHQDDLREFLQARKLTKKVGHSDITYRIIRPDGSIRHIHDLTHAEKDSKQNLVRIVGTIQDITERVESQLKLRETEKQFTLAVEGAGDGIWDWDIINNKVQLSHNYQYILGYTKQELPNDFNALQNFIHPDDRERNKQNLEEYLSARISKRNIEIRLKCKNGDYKWVLCRATIVNRDKEQNPIRMLGIQTDISQQKKVEQDLIQARQDAENANHAKSQFLSNMSHELRTPMNAIMGFGQLLKMDRERSLNQSQIENIDEILKAGKHLQELINEVLDLSRIEAGKVNLFIEPVSVNKIIDESLHLIAPLAKKQGIEINLIQDDHPVTSEQFTKLTYTVKADHTRLKQVLLNLISNGIKYNRPHGQLTINSYQIGKKRIRISVSDKGNGLTYEQQKQLFIPFRDRKIRYRGNRNRLSHM